MGEVLNYIELYNFYWENIMENTQESTQVPSAQIEQVSQFQESLTPTLLKENESAYESVRDLREALKAEDVLNIALTGPYGSGKVLYYTLWCIWKMKNGTICPYP